MVPEVVGNAKGMALLFASAGLSITNTYNSAEYVQKWMIDMSQDTQSGHINPSFARNCITHFQNTPTLSRYQDPLCYWWPELWRWTPDIANGLFSIEVAATTSLLDVGPQQNSLLSSSSGISAPSPSGQNAPSHPEDVDILDGTSKSPTSVALPPEDMDMSNTAKKGLVKKTNGSF